jgi:Fibronectin type III domain
MCMRACLCCRRARNDFRSDVSNNFFTGEVPDDLTAIVHPKLITLELHGNCFTTPWPADVTATCTSLGPTNCDPTPRPAAECNAPRPPSPPSDVAATPMDSALLVSWSTPSSGAVVDSYTIAAVREVPPASNVTLIVPGTRTSVVVGALVNGVAYIVSVVASNSRGASAPATVGPVTPCTVPGIAVNVSCASRVSGVVNVSWTDDGDGGAPVVNTTVEGTDGTYTVDIVVTTTNTTTLSSFAVGATVRLRVAPANTAGAAAWSSWSAPCTVCCTPTPTPTPAPTPLPFPVVYCNSSSTVSVAPLRNPSQNYLNVTLCASVECAASRQCDRFLPPNATVDLVLDATMLFLGATYCEKGGGNCLPADLVELRSSRVNASASWSPPLVALSSDKKLCSVDADCGSGSLWCRRVESHDEAHSASAELLFCTSECAVCVFVWGEPSSGVCVG